ncbi:hypothetical protein [uncultured Nostoc sp.]|uniref:hypothetical protein n=1 Tax=uncultured Nostoc sp. TaxID=340711 RepID=UPI0035C981B2
MTDYPVYAKLSNQKLSQLGVLEISQDLIESETGDCDPAWDYATIYPELKQAQTKLNYLTDEIGEVENATPVIDEALREAIDQLISKLQSVREKLK